MSRSIRWTKRALKELRRLDTPTRERILNALDELVQRSRGDVIRLAGHRESIYRLRVGGWRVLFTDDGDIRILVLRIRPRGDAYKG